MAISDEIFEGEPPTAMLVNFLKAFQEIDTTVVVTDHWPRIIEYFADGYIIHAFTILDVDTKCFYINLNIFHKGSLEFEWFICHVKETYQFSDLEIPNHLIQNSRTLMMRFCILCESFIKSFA